MQIVAFILATFAPLIVLYVIRALDLYQSGSFKTVGVCFGWGLVAYGLSYVFNTLTLELGWIKEWETMARFVAPVSEEIFKALILVWLVRRANFTYFVDGAIYGFAVGIGFAVIENYQYILDAPDMAFNTAVGRVISTNLVHACATALVGVALGVARFQRRGGRVGLLLAGLAAAILLHGAFNNMAAEFEGGPILVYGAVIALAAVGLIAWIIFRGLAEQRAWIEEKLGAADRVTGGEARIVHRLSDVGELLKPLRETFGDEKGDQIEQFLLVQARLGILRKTLDKLPDEKMRRGVEQQMAGLRTEMDKARRAVGPYIMLYVRNIFPEETSPLWGALETRIQEKIAARPATGGANLFSSLGQRMAPPKPQPSAQTGGNVAAPDDK